MALNSQVTGKRIAEAVQVHIITGNVNQRRKTKKCFELWRLYDSNNPFIISCKKSRTFCWCKCSFRSQTWLFVDNFWLIIWNCKCYFRFKDISFNLRVIELYKENAKSHYHVPYQNHLWFPYILHIFVLRQQEVSLSLSSKPKIKKRYLLEYIYLSQAFYHLSYLSFNSIKPSHCWLIVLLLWAEFNSCKNWQGLLCFLKRRQRSQPDKAHLWS